MADEVKVAETTHAPAVDGNKSDSGSPAVVAAPASASEKPTPAPATQATLIQPAQVEKKEPEKVTPVSKVEPLVVTADKLKLPDNSLVPKSYLEEIVKNAKTVEEAQNLVTQEHGAMERAQAIAQATNKAQEDKWVAEIVADPVYGGQNLNQTDQLATRTFKTIFGDDEFKDFASSIYAKKPGIIKGLAKLGKMLGESRLVPDRMPPTADGATKPKTWGQAVYGDNGAIADHEVQASRKL